MILVPALILGLVGASPGRADEAPPAVLFYAPAPVAERAAPARRVLERVVRRRGGVLVDRSPGGAPAPRAPALLRQAQDAYYRLAYQEALGALEAAAEEVARTGAEGLTTLELADLFLFRGLTVSEEGDAARAWEELLQAAVIDPARRLDPGRFPPRVVEVHERAVRAVTGGAMVSVVVRTRPGCDVHVDGRAVADGARVTVAAGAHFARVSCIDGARGGGRELVVVDGPLDLSPPAEAPPDPAAAARIGADNGAGRVLLAVVTPRAAGAPLLALSLVDRGGRVVRRAFRAIDSPGLEALVTELVTPAPVAATGPAPAAADTPWYRSGWVWAAGGAVVTCAALLPFLLDGDASAGVDVGLAGDLP